jgi:large conductance mechanosensitive channel
VKVSKKQSKIKKVTQIVKTDSGLIIGMGESQIKAFMDYIRSQGVVGLAVGLVLGGAVSLLVKSLIDNVVMPPVGLFLGSAEGLKGLSWVIGKTANGKSAVLNYGVFLNDLINFIVIALVVYLIIHLLRVEKFDKKKN